MSSDFLPPALVIIFSLNIGLFGLVGMLGVLVVPFSRRLIDMVVAWYATVKAVQTAAGALSSSHALRLM
jgi:uncharacterized protein YqgC (DUF456 family)